MIVKVIAVFICGAFAGAAYCQLLRASIDMIMQSRISSRYMPFLRLARLAVLLTGVYFVYLAEPILIPVFLIGILAGRNVLLAVEILRVREVG